MRQVERYDEVEMYRRKSEAQRKKRREGRKDVKREATKAKGKRWREESLRGKKPESLQDEKWKEEDLGRISGKRR